MDTSTVISLAGSFMKFVGEVLADMKSRDLAGVDVDLLRLKRKVLAEKLEDFKSSLNSAVINEKAKTEQDLISRRLANTTVRQTSLRSIDNDAANELERASREYNRAIEEIALMERKLQVQNRPPWWKKFLRACALSRG